MTKRPFSILILVGMAALALAGCKGDKATLANLKSEKPIPAPTLALMAEKGMRREDPILVRIYKEDSQLEVWKKRPDGKFAHLKTYEICRWSGDLGPKKKEGDKQAPEGFYTITPGQMNPNSAYFLSFDMGFPNAYDRSLGRTGKHLMVHGDCLSAGCYAMTDPQIAEVYALARDAFRGGQKSFQVQALPFRMTAENMARRRDNPNVAFWRNLKQGSDHFEVTKLEPKVNVCGKKYVFDAKADGTFDPDASCPTYQVEPSIATAVAAKAKRDEQKFAELTTSGYQLAAAYVPQNGRMRRELGTSVVPGVMVASAAPVQDLPAVAATPAPQASVALAMTQPAPTASAYNAAPKAETERSGGGLMGWMRRDPKPAELQTPQTPAAAPVAVADVATTASTPVEQARPQIAAQAPMTASMAGSPDYRPFYRKMLGVGGEPAPAVPARVATANPAPVTPAPRPAAASRPAVQPVAKAAPVPAPAPAAAPKPAQQTAQNLPQPAPTGLMSAAPILGAGTFR